MEIAMLAIRPVLAKLGDLLVGEFTLEKRARKGIESLVTELTLMHAALHKVAKLPPEKLDEGVKIWAGKVRELSYEMEDIVDAFMVRVEDQGESANPKNKVKKLLKKTIELFKTGKELHRISDALEEVVGQAKTLAELRQRYELEMRDTVDAGTSTSVDPRMTALYTDVRQLVGTEETSDELIDMLTVGDDLSKHPLKMVSIVGFGGLGKTTLAKIVYDKIKVQFDCCAFVSVSQNPDTRKVLKNILYDLDKHKYRKIHNENKEEKHLIDELIEFLTNKRYLIVIDDIWDKETWKVIKCAFSKESHGSRLITTTRIVSVSEACCSCSDDIFRMKPLSQDVSRELFHKRVFSHEKGCPPELVQVSEDILKKCGGIPLAIITIASLMASNGHIKGIDQWYHLLNSIGRGPTEDHGVDEMKKILLLSYYDLPFYLKPCLLYLSIYPEDHVILRDELVWKWISEGFVYSEKQETSLYKLGDSYFRELVNRSMIQPIHIDYEDKVIACRVHDMVLDLICSLASEENCVITVDGNERKNPNSQSNVRRLSVQNSKVDLATKGLAQLRSLNVFRDTLFDRVLGISSFKVLRVLHLEGFGISDVEHVGNLLHLRYLRLSDYNVEMLPLEIGNLQFLQTLDLRGSYIEELPSSVVRLRRLKCLHLSRFSSIELPPGIGNLTCLEVLEEPRLTANLNHHFELGHLTKLRILRFVCGYLAESMHKALVESLNHLHKLEILSIGNVTNSGDFEFMREGWVPSQQLRKLSLQSWPYSFLTLPVWVNPSSLHVLTSLVISLKEVRREDIQTLGMLPALVHLYLECVEPSDSLETEMEMFVVISGSYPCARECQFENIPMVPSNFPLGAAPRLQKLSFRLPARWIFRRDLDMGMAHLPSLESVAVVLWSGGATDAEKMKAEAALTAAANGHSNSPSIRIHTGQMGAPSASPELGSHVISRWRWNDACRGVGIFGRKQEEKRSG